MSDKNSSDDVPPCIPTESPATAAADMLYDAPLEPVALAKTNSIIRRVIKKHALADALHSYLVLVDMGRDQLRLLRDLRDEDGVWRADNHCADLSYRASVILVMREHMTVARNQGQSEADMALGLLMTEEERLASFPRHNGGRSTLSST